MNIRIERYGSELGDAWAGVLRSAKNGIFQFERAYMEYHADRFTDLSLLAFVDDQPVAILPAAIDAQCVVTSHPGLTFGGVVLDARIRSGVASGPTPSSCSRSRVARRPRPASSMAATRPVTV